MKIVLSKAQAEVLTVLYGPPFDFSRSGYRHSSRLEIDLTKFSMADIEYLKDEADRFLQIRGMPNISKELEMWMELNANQDAASAIKLTSVKKSLSVFFHFFSSTERKHVYRCIEEDGNNRWLAYHVVSIKHNPTEEFSPEHLTFNCIFFFRGEETSYSFSLYREDIQGNTCTEALQSVGIRIENSVLRAQYLEELEKFETISESIGRQFLATGIANSDGVDDASQDENANWWGRRSVSIVLDKDNIPSQVVIDVEKETDAATSKRGSKSRAQSNFWADSKKFTPKGEEANPPEEGESTVTSIEIPVHPYVTIFHLKKHIRLKTHVANLTEYQYDGSISDKLVLPPAHTRIIDCLMKKSKQEFSDVVKNKAGGVVVLSQGAPGTGKTLTAEIYSESLHRPLYAVQCSQLGLDVDSLEKNLALVLARGNRWGAVTLLDEADVYIHQRGNDLHQNAIVGVFLRVLEYQSGVLFLTTNRGDTVDDAILSRCTVRIPYTIPVPKDQMRIWREIAETNKVDLNESQIVDIVKHHRDLSGRDIKNLFKLMLMVYGSEASDFTPEAISEMRVYKATTTSVGDVKIT